MYIVQVWTCRTPDSGVGKVCAQLYFAYMQSLHICTSPRVDASEHILNEVTFHEMCSKAEHGLALVLQADWVAAGTVRAH